MKSLKWALGTGWYYQPVPKALHRYRVVTFTLVLDGTTNRYLRSLRYRLVLPTGTLGSSIGYFKRKIYPTRSEQLCSWDGKWATCEARGHDFKSQPKRIFCVNFEGLCTGCFTQYQSLSLWYHFGGIGSKNWYQSHSPTGAKGSFSSSVYMYFLGLSLKI